MALVHLLSCSPQEDVDVSTGITTREPRIDNTTGEAFDRCQQACLDMAVVAAEVVPDPSIVWCLQSCYEVDTGAINAFVLCLRFEGFAQSCAEFLVRRAEIPPPLAAPQTCEARCDRWAQQCPEQSCAGCTSAGSLSQREQLIFCEGLRTGCMTRPICQQLQSDLAIVESGQPDCPRLCEVLGATRACLDPPAVEACRVVCDSAEVDQVEVFRRCIMNESCDSDCSRVLADGGP